MVVAGEVEQAVQHQNADFDAGGVVAAARLGAAVSSEMATSFLPGNDSTSVVLFLPQKVRFGRRISVSETSFTPALAGAPVARRACRQNRCSSRSSTG